VEVLSTAEFHIRSMILEHYHSLSKIERERLSFADGIAECRLMRQLLARRELRPARPRTRVHARRGHVLR
jgi:hypothetical protein